MAFPDLNSPFQRIFGVSISDEDFGLMVKGFVKAYRKAAAEVEWEEQRRQNQAYLEANKKKEEETRIRWKHFTDGDLEKLQSYLAKEVGHAWTIGDIKDELVRRK